MLSEIKIILVGCGKMGSAMLQGWLKSGVKASNIVVVDPAASADGDYMVASGVDDIDAGFAPDMIILAVKPQLMSQIAPLYAKYDAAFLSIAAGKDIASLESYLGKNKAVIRSMPNLPAIISQGITALIANDNVSQAQKLTAQNLLESIGEVIFLEDENSMDAVTAVSGSGPAYLFYFVEAFIEAAINAGLDKNAATQLVYKTCQGSVELLLSSDENATTLRNNVTSPNGTTEAGLNILMNKGVLSDMLRDTVKAAQDKSKQLK